MEMVPVARGRDEMIDVKHAVRQTCLRVVSSKADGLRLDYERSTRHIL